MATIKITCDSASDLPEALSAPYRIQLLPMGVQLGQDCRRDLLDVSSAELYQYSMKTGKLPGISAVSVEEYRRVFSHYAEKGQQVLHISISGHLSGCYQNACQAAKDFPSVSVVDSESISAGAGQLAMLAAELASADYHLDELTSALNDLKKHMDVSCILENPGFFHRSGQAGGFAASCLRLLHLKPEITLKKGRLCHKKTFHGEEEQAILYYVRSCIAEKKNIQTDRIFLTYSGIPRSVIDRVKALLQQLQPFEEILEIPVSSAVSCRCGPGSLGLAFMTR